MNFLGRHVAHILSLWQGAAGVVGSEAHVVREGLFSLC